MRILTTAAGVACLALGALGSAQAQVSGTPTSPFPDAAPHEIRTINGVPCRTVLDKGTNTRVPVQCAAQGGMMGLSPAMTGSIMNSAPVTTGAVSGTPGSAFPNAAPHEIRTINGVPCRTVLVPGTDERVPVECAR
jgi:hypothetical protein